MSSYREVAEQVKNQYHDAYERLYRKVRQLDIGEYKKERMLALIHAYIKAKVDDIVQGAADG